MPTYLLYARVSPKGSTWSGAETTVPDQLRDGRAYVLARDPKASFLEAWDELASADHRRMHALRGHLDAMRAGVADWDTLVFRHIDRVGRSALEVIQLGADLARHGKGMLVYAMPFPTEPPIGPVIFGIFALLAEFERSMISARTKAKMHAIARAGGIPYGRAPFGYRRTKGSNTLSVHDREAQTVREVFRRYADGDGPAAIAADHHISVRSVWDILRRRVYLGLIAYDGAEHPGAHPPIIDDALWNRAQTRLPKPGTGERRNARKSDFLLTGLLRCHCGRALTAASAHGKSGAVHRYYQCTDRVHCRSRWNADRLEAHLIHTLQRVQLTPKQLADVQAKSQRDAQSLAAQSGETITGLQTALRQAAAERDRTMDLFLAGIVNPSNAGAFNARLSATLDEISRLEQRLAVLQDTPPIARARIEYAQAALQAYQRLSCALEHDGPTRSAILHACVRSIAATPDGWDITLNLPGSPNAALWRAMGGLGEPMAVACVGGSRLLLCPTA